MYVGVTNTVTIIGNNSSSYGICKFSTNSNVSGYVALIDNTGAYTKNSDENKKHNLKIKTNY